MNILIVTAMFPPVRTGTSFYSKNLADTLQKHGHNVTVVTVKRKDQINDNYIFNLIRIKSLQFNLKNFFKHLSITCIFPSNYKKISLTVKRNKIDVILIVNHYLDIAFPAIYAAKKNKIPLFVSIGTLIASPNKYKNKILGFFDKLICGKLIFSYCNKIISWDTEIERYLNDIHGVNKIKPKSEIITFAPNGNIKLLEEYKNNYSLKKQIIGVGAVMGFRNYVFHIKVFNELLKEFPDFTLKIIGHIYTDDAKKLSEKYGLQDKVIFKGELDHNKVLEEMKQSDIHWMMLNSQYRGIGTAGLEAMLLGMPCVLNVPENLIENNILKDMESYIYTDGFNIEETVKKISIVIKNQELREKIGQGGRRFVQENMNWDKVAYEMINLFSKNLKK